MKTHILSNTARRVLDSLAIRGNVVKIPLGKPEAGVYAKNGMLERSLYEEINAALAAIGGKWNRKERGHIFEEDPADALEEIQLTGQFKRVKSAKQLFGFFETPTETVKQLVDLAEIEDNHHVLEPSAGRGRIASEIIKITSLLTIVELLPANREHLKKIGFGVDLEPDFLKYTNRYGFDRIVMNPPFAPKQADHDHVLHAYSMLRPGGRLVSIMAAGVEYRMTKKSEQVRRLIETGGTHDTIPLPAGTFRESGTDVQTVIVIINKVI